MGDLRDIGLLGPPFVVTETKLDQMVDVLHRSIDQAAERLARENPAA